MTPQAEAHRTPGPSPEALPGPLRMEPAPGTHLLRYVGDQLRLRLGPARPGWTARVRTTLTRAGALRQEVVDLAASAGSERTFAGAAWRDLPMREDREGWVLDCPLLEVGVFRAKAFAVDLTGRQHWPEGADLHLSVHPDGLRTANTVYCAFPRLLGPGWGGEVPPAVADLDARGCTVIPASGTLRDLTARLPHIFGALGCRILHLLPVGPVPTTFARMGRYGSPYAQLDLTQIDPALVAFDRKATAEDQFRELASAVHQRSGRLLLDIVVNHTGWGARLMSEHPEWYRRDAAGIQSPSAWGNTWADLAELEGRDPALWETLAQALLVWCQRGVDGFRCDAGYMVPLPVWEYVIARVRQAFPETAFLLEGLGGAWEATAERLAGGMQWAYSELFQNEGAREVSGYLDHALTQGARLGPLLHYSETHDNPRLAVRGRDWSLLRNRLCALTSQSGAWGFTSGVEWLATGKVDVHEPSSLAWGQRPNLVRELGDLNRLLAHHPCFFDGAATARLSPADSPVLALLRVSAEGLDRGLVLVNLDPTRPQGLVLDAEDAARVGPLHMELLGQPLPPLEPLADGGLAIHLPPGWAGFLVRQRTPVGLEGEAYRTRRAQAAWAMQALAWVLPSEAFGPCDWVQLGRLAAADPGGLLEALPHLDARTAATDPVSATLAALAAGPATYPALVRWAAADARRITPVPPGHPVLVIHPGPFTLQVEGPDDPPLHLRAVPVEQGFVAALPPRHPEADHDVALALQPEDGSGQALPATLRYLTAHPKVPLSGRSGHALLVNGRGGYARIPADLFRVTSKYDALLAANLDPRRPVDRHVLAKRLRIWAIADGFLTALDGACLATFEAGATARWLWTPHAGEGRRGAVALEAWMPPEENTLRLRIARLPSRPGDRPLPAEAELRLTLRFDLEDRNHHQETEGSPQADAHFREHTHGLPDRPGFRFAPAPERSLRVACAHGNYHPEPEWSRGIPHPEEQVRSQRDRGDAWSPGWFELILAEGESAEVVVTAEATEPAPTGPPADPPAPDLEAALRKALPAFLARRDGATSVIAGYPWFLDWGRDALVVARGLLAAGRETEALGVLRAFGALEREGTLPNTLNGAEDGNRESSDAPLWFALACDDLARRLGVEALKTPAGGRTLLQVLASIARHTVRGTATGVSLDRESGLLWSPGHFTWMDTNHPAGTPREGYPVELQGLWLRLQQLLARLGECAPGEPWAATVERTRRSLDRFWREDLGYASDTLHAARGVPACSALGDDHLRPNQLWLVTLGHWSGPRARRLVAACGRHLLVPGALRSLAPRDVVRPLAVLGAQGQPLNDPHRPYWGHYEGDEDTHRKPAYHNGTAWVWLLPLYAEALAAAWPDDPAARAAARALLGSCTALLGTGAQGQLPELLDGDAPHRPRGCDAQAWSVSETLRVWLALKEAP
ncbi:MAG TPA: amylo-alpha-1,6-glucosidase [Holophagaceae bacterium]|nr:amylo-alpha-1,6-glucosidase [Holophagaceae bacterium]